MSSVFIKIFGAFFDSRLAFAFAREICRDLLVILGSFGFPPVSLTEAYWAALFPATARQP
jgi:hypothetical protein